MIAGLASALLAVAGAAAPPPLELIDPASGAPVVVEAEGAKAVHLVFLATWCEPCLGDLDRLADLEARWGGDEYRLVLIAVPSRQDPERLRRFVASRTPPGRVVWDARGEAMRAFAVDEIPAHRVLDGSGHVVYRGVSVRGGVADAVSRLMRAPAVTGGAR